jgi:hypothetical protein
MGSRQEQSQVSELSVETPTVFLTEKEKEYWLNMCHQYYWQQHVNMKAAAEEQRQATKTAAQEQEQEATAADQGSRILMAEVTAEQTAEIATAILEVQPEQINTQVEEREVRQSSLHYAHLCIPLLPSIYSLTH